ncbi:hypothetical protein BKM03_19530 [Pseudomonas avellanae]|uniref:Uncharacterized protein n=4 Tax=Pseudomonas syringae group TaxID=136849 RepID=A0AAD0GPB6_9PSED|nr:hypothetical protein BKM03_19530 [Pseudomonas avellanae]POP85432.1 hypothetical protein CXB34_16860 [Pseudomonas amygdali pv. morsprunorum]RML56632.1 hypothetical protein ALQ94_02125 [Pseudomonas amygdali pv. morsprunorum]
MQSQTMHRIPSPAKRFVRPSPCEGSFHVRVNSKPFQAMHLSGQLALRAELEHEPDRWIWKLIVDGKVGTARTTIGLFLDSDLKPGDHDLVNHAQIKVIFNETLRRQNTIYHSADFQSGTLSLFEANPYTLRLRGRFRFSMSSINFDVTDGFFDVRCQ